MLLTLLSVGGTILADFAIAWAIVSIAPLRIVVFVVVHPDVHLVNLRPHRPLLFPTPPCEHSPHRRLGREPFVEVRNPH